MPAASSFVRCITCALLVILIPVCLYAQSNLTTGPIEKKKYYTRPVQGNITIDGVPDDAQWGLVEWGGDFVQYMPNENTAPAYPTYFKILYDGKFLYIAYKCMDANRDSVVKRMGRRDEFPGDWVEINIDAYHDLRTGFSFTVSASGVRGDEFISNNGDNWDGNWNPIWYAKTNINDSGWTAEVRIPLSQLRYGKEPDKVWGIQVQRRIFRKEERSTWQYIPQSTGAWVSNFGELHGLAGILPQKQIEIAPYVVAQTAKYQKQIGNPFATGTDMRLSAGLDGKVAITSDLILDFTINPDFGQVEADPSQVRIDGYQNFFEERRPFFIESRNIFQYQLTGSSAGGNYDNDLLFYSRRIGGSPHSFPFINRGEYVKMPDNTSILGAAKFSGKTRKGWSIGILESITQREKATIDLNGNRRYELVEPLTSYFVGRLQKDIDSGNTVVGGIFTLVNREEGLSDIHSKAYSGGLDLLHYWKSRRWYYKGNILFSHVEGTPEAIYTTQTSFEHLFQRSNISHVKLDNNRTSLTGTGGTFKIGKAGGAAGKMGQIFLFETGVTWRSPQLELNDIGFMLSADEINHFTWAGIQFQQPFSIFRNARVSYNHWARWDFGGQLLYVAFDGNAHGTFKNFWQVGGGLSWNPYEVSNNALRGASALRRPAGMGGFFYTTTDTRKKVYGSFNYFKGWGFNETVGSNNYDVGLHAQPLDAMNTGLSVGYSNYFRKQDQFVSQAVYNNELRTVVSRVDQQTMRITFRLNYNITPDLTIQYYGQPFITRPLYSQFAYVADPLNADYNSRFQKYDATQISYANNEYSIDEDRDGVTDYSFYQPDFNFVQFRSNLVIRWEYRPGSELYLVWSQGNTPAVANDLATPIASSLLDNMFTPEARNIGLIKLTYRFLK